MSRGVLAILGNPVWSSSDMINSITNYYDIPFMTWSHLTTRRRSAKVVFHHDLQLATANLTLLASMSNRSFNRVHRELTDINYTFKESAVYDHRTRYLRESLEADNEYEAVDDGLAEEIQAESLEIEDASADDYDFMGSQIYLRPDIAPALIDLIKYYSWNYVYYIYNHEEAIYNMETLFDYQLKNVDFAKKILIRKVKNIQNCRDMLR